MMDNPAARELTRDILAALRHRRISVEKTQDDVAETLGTTQSAIAKLELGYADPLLVTLIRYAAAVSARLVVSVVPDDGSEPPSVGVAFRLRPGGSAGRIAGWNSATLVSLVEYDPADIPDRFGLRFSDRDVGQVLGAQLVAEVCDAVNQRRSVAQ